jgi:hypothetical protein
MRCRDNRVIAVTSLWVALACAGCATSISESDLNRQLTKVAQPYARSGPQQMIPIYAESRMVAIGLLAEARNDSNSPLSRRVGHQLDRAHRRNAHAVVGGPYADLSDRILTNALNLNEDGQLRGLKVLFVSDAAPTPALLEAARLSQARIHHRTPQ